jgi:hypothetical protein
VAEHRLIKRYSEVLQSELPARLADEVADGLMEAYTKHLQQGMNRDDAAQAAVAEFGDPRAVVAEFTRSSPVRRIAQRLIATGPVVGMCWAAALITGRAWQWPIPGTVRALVGAALALSVAVLLTAALARRYRVVHLAGVAGCSGLVVLDASAISAAVIAAPGIRFFIIVAMAASAVRLFLITRAVRPALT